MKQNETKKVPESSAEYYCKKCDYIASKKSLYMRHLSTAKHSSGLNETKMKQKSSKQFQCICGLLFNSRTTLWRHSKICKNDLETSSNMVTYDLVLELIKDNKDMKQIIMEQNTTIQNLVKNGTITNSLNNTTNTFNLQFFLNETCKNAMNIMDFVDSIKLQLGDLERMGEIGYVDGISNIITKNLKALDISLRPVHCTDKKRETIYIKDENKWEKEDDNKSKLRKAIKKVANKNIKLLPEFREKNPEYGNSSSNISDKYDKIVIEAMGGLGNNDIENETKIVHNISKNIIIDK